MLIRTKGIVDYDSRENGNVLCIDIPDEEILALGKRYFELAAGIPDPKKIKVSENQMPFEESRKKLFDDILEKYSIDEITRNLGVILNDHDMEYYGNHTSEWFWMWYFIKDIYNSAAKENE